MEGDGISLWSFPKRDQNRLKKLIDHLQTDSITLTNVDIKQALITFITNYRQSYSINYESGDIEIF